MRFRPFRGKTPRNRAEGRAAPNPTRYNRKSSTGSPVTPATRISTLMVPAPLLSIRTMVDPVGVSNNRSSGLPDGEKASQFR